MKKDVGVVVTIENKPADLKDLANYLILLMDWQNRAESSKQFEG